MKQEYKIVRDMTYKDTQKILLGNKSDLTEKRVISKKDGESLR